MYHRIYMLLMALLLIALAFSSCTDLSEQPISSVTPDNFYGSEAELVAAVMPVYASLRNFSWGNPMFLQEVSSDEILIPQRGGDWGDGNTWKDLHRHEWQPTLSYVNGGWTELYQGVARANSVLENLETTTSTSALIPTFIAEVKVMRAYYYLWLLDLFGDVPLVVSAVTDPDNPPAQTARAEVFDFVISEINSSLDALEDTHGDGGWGRVTTGAANAILANAFLNAEVYTGSPMWAECIAACDAVINSGMYDLLPVYADNFTLANQGAGNVETIWAVGHKNEDGVGFNRHMATLHYNQLPSTPWNGFSVVEDYYNTYDPDDVRLNHILTGQQKVLAGPNAGQDATDRTGAPLVFSVTVSSIDNASESEGPRILKWEVDPAMSGGNAGDDYAIFRYSHILLTKAEALLNQGNNGAATDLVNQVRERAFEPDEPLANVTDDDILNERGFEMLWENVRRQDQIRHGKFTTTTWNFKDVTEAHRVLFPIPQSQLDANPNLKQNPGY